MATMLNLKNNPALAVETGFMSATEIFAIARNVVTLLPITACDSDGDGMPDIWERAYGLNPFDPSDAAGDPDGDGTSNLDEFRRGTNPLRSNLREAILAARSYTERRHGDKGANKAGREEPTCPEPCDRTTCDIPTDG